MVSNVLPPTRWAAVYVTTRFVQVETRSGYRRNLGDGGRYKACFGTDVADAALGRSVLEALNRSRFLDPKWNRKFFEMATIMAYNDAWIEDLMTRYGFKTKARLFDKMAF